MASSDYNDFFDDESVIDILIPLIIVASCLLLTLLLIVTAWLVSKTRRGIALRLGDESGAVNVEEEEMGEGEIERLETALLGTLDSRARENYERAKIFSRRYPPDSLPSEITLSQYLSIQEKGVSAWEFEPDLENTTSFVEARTEIAFYDGECSVQANLPMPKQNEVYYFEAKLYEKPETTTITVGLSTKPYPLFRMVGMNRHSVAYMSSDGSRYHNHAFSGKAYGPAYYQGDVIGLGYRPRTGTVFFTRNGKKLEDAYTNLRMNLFPTIGADGPAQVHVNFGQAGFVFIEANVKKWGLAPMMGTLAPPPAYGSERGSILLETGLTPGSQAGAVVGRPDHVGASTAGRFVQNNQETKGHHSFGPSPLAQLSHMPQHQQPLLEEEESAANGVGHEGSMDFAARQARESLAPVPVLHHSHSHSSSGHSTPRRSRQSTGSRGRTQGHRHRKRVSMNAEDGSEVLGNEDGHDHHDQRQDRDQDPSTDFDAGESPAFSPPTPGAYDLAMIDMTGSPPRYDLMDSLRQNEVRLALLDAQRLHSENQTQAGAQGQGQAQTHHRSRSNRTR